MSDDMQPLCTEAAAAIASCTALPALEALRVHYLGKKGILTEALKALGQLPIETRPVRGAALNMVKQHIAALISERHEQLAKADVLGKLASDKIDITLPGRPAPLGSIHPITKNFMRIQAFFANLGFMMMEGPEIEDDEHNFQALNIPADHPARGMQDTFYFGDGRLLRTHTSPVQVRAMKRHGAPLRVMAKGRVYRRDFDMTHTPMFHQMEGLMVQEQLSFADLKGIILDFLRAFFECDIKTRYRPSYFPFTEPSAEVDIQCVHCFGAGCKTCGHSGWIEVLGCGMVHPHVLTQAGIDSERFVGFAFGLGVDRLTLLRYRIPDLRTLFENDLRFLKQF